MSIRQQIVNALKDRLRTITPLNGYQCDFSGIVDDWKTLPIEEDDTLKESVTIEDSGCVNIGPYQPDDNADEDEEYRCVSIDIYFITFGSDSKEKIRLGRQEIIKAIGTDKTFGGLVDKCEFENDVTQFAYENRRVGGLRISIKIYYIVPAWTD